MTSKKQGRTLGNTVQDLLDSKRLELSIDLYKRGNRSALKAILIELGKECLTVAKNATVREAGRNWSLPYYHAKPVLQHFNDFQTFNIFWGLSDPEVQLYLAQIKGESEEEVEKLSKKVAEHFGIKL